MVLYLEILNIIIASKLIMKNDLDSNFIHILCENDTCGLIWNLLTFLLFTVIHR